MKTRHLILPLALLAAGPACGQDAPGPQPSAPGPVVPSPPAFKVDMTVVDQAGVAVGQIKSLAESERGPIVIVEIDGKLVGLLQRTLTLERGQARSVQTKSEMLTAADAPR
jgi:hypothetical protein